MIFINFGLFFTNFTLLCGGRAVAVGKSSAGRGGWLWGEVERGARQAAESHASAGRRQRHCHSARRRLQVLPTGRSLRAQRDRSKTHRPAGSSFRCLHLASTGAPELFFLTGGGGQNHEGHISRSLQINDNKNTLLDLVSEYNIIMT